jgi:surface protein
MLAAFRGVTNLTIKAKDTPNLTNVTSMSEMFREAVNLTGNFSGWDTSRVTNMNSLFSGATNFNLPLSGWDISKVTTMTNFLNGATNYNQDLSALTPVSVVGAGLTTAFTNTNLSTFNYNALLSAWAQLSGLQAGVTFGAHPVQYGGCVESVANASEGIEGRSALVTSGWVITDGGLAPSCSRPFITTWQVTADNQTLTLPVESSTAYSFQIDWGDEGADRNIQSYTATNPKVVHTYANSGTYTITIWGSFPRLYCNGTADCANLLSVDQWGDNAWSSFNNAFNRAINVAILAEDVPNMTNVKDMTSMFYNATNLTGNFSGWDTSKVQNMTNLFYNASGFDQDLSSRSIMGINAADNRKNILFGTHLSPYNYNALLDSWSKQPTAVVATANTFVVSNAKYGGCGVENAQLGIEGHQRRGLRSWQQVDAGILPDCMRPFITTWLTAGKSPKVTIPTAGTGYIYDVVIDWGDGTTTTYPNGSDYATTAFGHTYDGTFAADATHQVSIRGRVPRIQCNNAAGCANLLSIDQWGDISPRSFAQSFYGAKNLTINATDTPNLINVETVAEMFYNVTNLTGNFSGWNFTNSLVTTMASMFRGATNFNQDLDSRDVSKVSTLTNMFYNATAFNGSLSGRYWTVPNVLMN